MSQPWAELGACRQAAAKVDALVSHAMDEIERKQAERCARLGRASTAVCVRPGAGPIAMMVAIVVALCAFLLAMGAIAVFASDSGGTGAVVGLFAALGALALSYARRPIWARLHARPVRASRSQRIALALLGEGALGWGGHRLVTGQFDPSRGQVVDRIRHPGKFWQLVLFFTGVGILLLYTEIRRLAPDRFTSEDHDDADD